MSSIAIDDSAFFPRLRRPDAVLTIFAVLALSFSGSAHGSPQTSPVADAGLSRYAARDPIRLDGTGSYDPDGDPITSYRWVQVSGPEVEIADADTATPTVSDFNRTVFVETVEIELVVSDGLLESDPDTVDVILVPRTTHWSLRLYNGPFRPDLPTVIAFGGGDCVDGMGMGLNAAWKDRFNVISGPYHFPYADQAFQVMVMLSEFAPDYDQPIQTVGFSTGGNAASIVPNIINRVFNDPRYAINRMTLLDSWCDIDFAREIADFSNNPVAGEPAWAEVFRSHPEPIPGALNVSFFPGGDHSTPLLWFLDSMDEGSWTDGDLYNQGVTAGYYLSVGGSGRNLQLATDGIHYYFECRHVGVGCLQQIDASRYSGLIPEPPVLIGPEDGVVADPLGEVLSCEPSQNAIGYELLFGSSPHNMTETVSDTPTPPDFVASDLPFSPTYWTIRVRDDIGSTVFAPPRALHPYDPTPPRRSPRRVSPGR